MQRYVLREYTIRVLSKLVGHIREVNIWCNPATCTSKTLGREMEVGGQGHLALLKHYEKLR